MNYLLSAVDGVLIVLAISSRWGTDELLATLGIIDSNIQGTLIPYKIKRIFLIQTDSKLMTRPF